MGGRYYVLMATLMCLMSTGLSTEKRDAFVQQQHSHARSLSSPHWQRSNTMSREGSGHGPGDKGGGEGGDDEEDDQGWPSYDGSADNEEGSGYKGDDTEGSAMPPSQLTPCQKQKHNLEMRPGAGHILRCTPAGAFQPKQCDPHTNDCWCVDEKGSEIAGSRRNKPASPHCDSSKGHDGWHLPEEKDKDTYVGVHTPVDTDDGFEIDKIKDKEPMPDIAEISPDDDDTVGGYPDSGDHERRRVDTRTSLFHKPGLLAGVIGGAVIGLLCAVLLVMFVVYRMRKKDEGSYPLDEPKKPLNYTKTQHNQEYFA